MIQPDDMALIEAALSGQRRAFDELVERYYKVIFNVALRMISDKNDAADITQSVFIKAFTNLKSYNSKFKFFSWIYRIAVNESLNFIKSQEQRSEELNDEFPEEHTPESLSLRSELELKIQNALMKLKPEHRAVIILTHFQGLSYREAGDILHIPEKTVKSRLFSSRQMLKELLIQDGVEY